MPSYTGSNKHTFARKRPVMIQPGDHPVHLAHSAEKRDTHYRPLPDPTRPEPYRLDLAEVLSAADHAAIVAAGKLIFHFNGDMGGIRDAMPQQLVAKGMEKSFDPHADAGGNPAFLYVTGDCVYFNGEVREYYAQFYEPYEFYPRPIFAVPGNHDGENVTDATANGGQVPEDSLLGFVRNFCAKEPVHMPEAMDSHRTAMTQPNVYWTLTTPFLNIVGLYSNVPEGGAIRSPQTAWLESELRTLPADKPLVVALHHPPYSADDHHSGSTHMRDVIDAASAAAGRAPDMVVAGHVHNYQRLDRVAPDGTVQPYLVTGAGGYHNLHHVQKVDGHTMIAPVVMEHDEHGRTVNLLSYLDDHHGFLEVTVEGDQIVGQYFQVPRPQEPYSKGNQLCDHWEFDWRQKAWVPNSLV